MRVFLGIELDEAVKGALQRVPPRLLEYFIGKEEYLQKMEVEGLSYIGKYLEATLSLSQLQQSEEHLCSLYKKILPPDLCSQRSPILIPIAK